MSDKTVEKALVLSGGSIKGAFQAGAIAHVLEAGFCPDAIYGTSVGSLNGGFLAERAGREAAPNQTPNWPKLGQGLEEFWRKNIHSPGQIVRKRGTLALLWALVTNKFDGLTDTGPLRELVAKEFEISNLHASPFDFYACAVNLVSGEAVCPSNEDPQIIDYIIASTAIPIEMPVKWIGKLPFVDGGARDIAPLKQAIDAGAQEIVCIICQPRKLEALSFNVGNLMQYALRLMDVITNELVNNDVDRFRKDNEWAGEYEQVRGELQAMSGQSQLAESTARQMGTALSRLKRWRQIDLTVIRPDKEIILDLLHFTPAEINEIITLGRRMAEKVYPPTGTP
jgi:NTE family protein